MGDGAILDRLVEALRREGVTQKLYDSVPLTLWRKALRMFKR